MKTTEGNKLIAEFMGYRFYKHLPIKRDGWQLESNKDTALYLAHNDSDLKYHSSWDWLMPVIRKIKDTELSVYTEKGSYLVERIDEGITSVDIDNVFMRVIEFIKWYNENK